MKIRLISFSLLCLAVICLCSVSFAGTADRELVVQFFNPIISEEKGTYPAGVSVLFPELDVIFTANGVEYLESVFADFPKTKVVNGSLVNMPDYDNYYLIRIDDAQNLVSFFNEIQINPELRTVDFNKMEVGLLSCEAPDDPHYEVEEINQWYLNGNSGYPGHVNVNPAWDLICEVEEPGTPLITIMDSGVEPVSFGDPPILEISATSSNTTESHGTKVLSIAAAVANNGVGIAGISRGHAVSISYDIDNSDYSITDFGKDIKAALASGTTVFSTSAEYQNLDGPFGFNSTLLKHHRTVFLSGVPFVAASGNLGHLENQVVYPGHFGAEVICVGATTQAGGRWVNSSYGPKLDFCAPGVDIAAVVPGAEGSVSYQTGTSGAQPIVTGAICLMQVMRDDLIAEDFEGILKSTCTDILPSGVDNETGWGRINIGRAVANMGGVYEIQHGQVAASSVDSLDIGLIHFYGFDGIVERNLYQATQFEMRGSVAWQKSYRDSVFCWGMHTQASGFARMETYRNFTHPVHGVSNYNMAYPVYATVDTVGAEFVSYAYRVDVDGETVWIGSPDPASCILSYGVIGKIRYPLPGPTISPIAEYPLILGGTDNSFFAVSIENNGSTTMTVTADLTPIGGAPDAILLDTGEDPDQDADDRIFTSPRFTSPVQLGTYNIDVWAQGDIGLPTEQIVTVEAIEPGVMLVDGSSETDQLAQLLGEPYAGIYFNSPVSGSDEDVLMISKDSASEPEIFRQDFISSGGAPEMKNKNISWFQSGEVPNTGCRGVFAADIDNDGDEDLFICHNNQSTRLYENTGNGFEDSTFQYFGINEVFLQGAHVAAWGDYNQDGKLDLFVSTMDYQGSIKDLTPGMASNPQWYLFKNTGDSFELTYLELLATPGLTLSASWNDVNNDGLLDLVVGEFEGRIAGSPTVILNQGYNKQRGHYQLAEDPATATITNLKVNSLDWVDYNHDDYPDLVVTEFGPNTGARILRNTGNGFAEAMVLTNEDLWTGSVIADYNQSGREDIVLLPKAGHPTLFVGDPSDTLSYTELAYPLGLREGATSGGFAADFNDDKDPDLYLGRVNSDEFLYKNERVDGTNSPVIGQQNWIRFNLGTLGNCNASLIGTRVTVKYGIQQWTQTVDGGSGRGGQRSNEMHFGLGNTMGPLDVTVDWPVSTPMDYTGLAINTIHTISDNAVPTINSESENFSHEPYPGGADWVFTWTTPERGSEQLDEVELEFVGYFPGDYCWFMANTTLKWGDPDVEISIFPLVSGGWGHQVIWRNKPCLGEQICNYEFRVSSSVGTQTPQQGSWVSFGEFDVCIIKNPFSN